MSRTALLTSQLNAVLRLTQTEIMLAETRRAQAATPAIERELAQNADHGRERMDLIAEAIRDLGGVPDVLGIAVGRVGATVKTVLEQGQDLDEALLADLELERQLLDRSAFIGMLADALDEPSVARVAERLHAAHSETVDWLLARLAEVALGGPVALRPTPAQRVAGFSRRVSQLPARQTAGIVNRTVQVARRTRRVVGGAASTQVTRTREVISDTAEAVRAGRDASLKRSEQLAARRGDDDRATSIHGTRRDLGALDAAELPIRNYDTLTAPTATERIERLKDADDVRAVLAYEQAHKARRTVVDAAERRLDALAEELVAAS